MDDPNASARRATGAAAPRDPSPDAAKRRRLKGFLNHLIVFFGVMVVLVPINARADPETPWFVFAMVAWGAPLAVHAARAMGLWGRG